MRQTHTFELTGADGQLHKYSCQQHGGIAATKLWLLLLKIVGVPLGQMWDAIDRITPAKLDDGAANDASRADYFAPEAPLYESTLDHHLDDDDDAAQLEPEDPTQAELDAVFDGKAAPTSTFIKGQLAGRALQTIVENVLQAGGPKLLLEIFRHTQRDGVHLVNPTTMRGTGFDQAYGGNPSEMLEALYEVLKINFGSIVSRPPFVGRSVEIVSFMSKLRPSTSGNPT